MVHFDFKDKIALVTGGSSGLGLAIVNAFARAGATVLVVSRNPFKAEEQLRPYGESCVFMPADLSKPEIIPQLFDQVQQRFGKLHYAINSAAATSGVGKSLQQFTEQEYDHTFTVNVKSLWLCMKYQIELMAQTKSDPCQIINISSVNGLGGVEGGSLYAASKAAIIALAKSAALELAKTHISVNAVVPGGFDTPMLQEALALQTNRDPEQLAALRKQYEAMIPSGRIGRPEELASAVLWLCSGTSPYLTGHSLIMDGGLSSRFH
jgi:NAD(P)-dependent dehydrogenase (short-subunit alcohol dehydrogenase family)